MVVSQRKVHAEDAVLVGGGRGVRVDVDLELDHVPERPGRDLDLLVDAALGLLDRALADDGQAATADLDADRRKVDPGEVTFDDGLLRLAAVIDIDVRGETGSATGHVAGPAPRVAEHLVHFPAHPCEVGKKVAI
mgnify:CR=1 FL=1